MLPKFNVAVLSPSREDGLPSCMELISSIITSRLNHANSMKEQFTVLAEQCLSLLEALCWNIPEQYEQVYVYLYPLSCSWHGELTFDVTVQRLCWSRKCYSGR